MKWYLCDILRKEFTINRTLRIKVCSGGGAVGAPPLRGVLHLDLVLHRASGGGAAAAPTARRRCADECSIFILCSIVLVVVAPSARRRCAECSTLILCSIALVESIERDSSRCCAHRDPNVNRGAPAATATA
ncbi:hypothetical protein KUF71_012524 [Frankliniella fusca]|uniref:Uncharacterized protein n=1 Tax=Frankliniella fusca TaxID=407009 RepID=A0AAE1LNH1_9NEOP|nr:hypothetical protein KUF71_012524 [Frankliniella fusca]